MNILDKIIAHKKKEVEQRKSLFPVKRLEESPYFGSPCHSLKKALLQDGSSGVIAEFKRKSPSKGVINGSAKPGETTKGYFLAGAAALSVLTDSEFFGGDSDDLLAARKANDCPILRKDFMIDEYQVLEAKSIGADVVLLLANVLTAREIKQFAATARSLGMDALLEIRDKRDLESICSDAACVGVNNRNLKDFKVDVKQSFDLAALIPDEFVKISESGIDSPETILDLRKAGYRGFLIGETFMRQSDPGKACADLVKDIKRMVP